MVGTVDLEGEKTLAISDDVVEIVLIEAYLQTATGLDGNEPFQLRDGWDDSRSVSGTGWFEIITDVDWTIPIG